MTDATTFGSSKDFTKTVTIEVGNTESDSINLGGASIVGIFPDTNIKGTSVKFKASADNATFVDYIKNDSAAPPVVSDVEATVTANKWLGLNATDFAGIQYVKLVSGTTQAGSDSVITLVLRGTPA
jgi:hypothetical protein